MISVIQSLIHVIHLILFLCFAEDTTDWPVKLVSYNASYNSESLKHDKEDCARYYGRTFLDHMTKLSLRENLTQICSKSNPPAVKVSIIPKVTAVIKDQVPVCVLTSRPIVAL